MAKPRGMGAINALKRRLSSLEAVHVDYGLFAGDENNEGREIVDYAFVHEFGSERVPARPFNRMAFDSQRAAIVQECAAVAGRVLGGASTDAVLQQLGRERAQKLQEFVRQTQIAPALAPSTVKKKGGRTDTLVDTGAMVAAIKHKLSR